MIILKSGTCKFQEKGRAVLLVGGDLDVSDTWMDPHFVSEIKMHDADFL